MNFSPANEFLVRIKVNESLLSHPHYKKREDYKELLHRGKKNHFDFEDNCPDETRLLKIREQYIKALKKDSLKFNFTTLVLFGVLLFLSVKVLGF